MDYENDILLPKFPLEDSAEFHTKRGVPLPAIVTGRAASIVTRKREKRGRAKKLLQRLPVAKLIPAKGDDETEAQPTESESWA